MAVAPAHRSDDRAAEVTEESAENGASETISLAPDAGWVLTYRSDPVVVAESSPHPVAASRGFSKLPSVSGPCGSTPA